MTAQIRFDERGVEMELRPPRHSSTLLSLSVHQLPQTHPGVLLAKISVVELDVLDVSRRLVPAPTGLAASTLASRSRRDGFADSDPPSAERHTTPCRTPPS